MNKTKLLKVKINNEVYEYWFKKGTYIHGERTSITANEMGTGEIEILTINLPNAPLKENETFFKFDYLKEMRQAMIDEGLIEFIETVPYNLGTYERFRFLPKFEEYCSDVEIEDIY